MKEASEFKRTLLETQPTTRHSFQSRRPTLVPDSPHPSSDRNTRRFSTGVLDIQNPQLLKEGRYEKVFQDILRDTKRIYKHLGGEQQAAENATVKTSIRRVLQGTDQEEDFNERFLIKPKLRSKTARSSAHRNLHLGATRPDKELEDRIGLTRVEREGQFREYFFSDQRKVIGLQEESMLLEYFLKDEDQHQRKVPVGYLASLPQTSRHRRLTPHVKDANALYRTHDEKDYRSLKRRVHLKEQFVQRCGEMAKKNLTFRRRQNFKEIEFILRESNQHMMEENILHDRTDEERTQLTRNNRLIRLFLRYQFFLSHSRVHQYFTDNCVARFKTDLYALHPALAPKDKDIDTKINEILQYKQSKILHFQDFKELVSFISDVAGVDVVGLFLQKRPEFFELRSETVMKAHEHEIEKYMVQHKIKFLLELIFNTFPEKLIGKRVLPIKLIPSCLKAYGITEKDFDLHHLFHSYHWMQHYDAGLTFEQFYRGSIIMGVKGNNWKGIEQLLRKIDIKKYI